MNETLDTLYGPGVENDTIANIPDAYEQVGIFVSDLYYTLTDYISFSDVDLPFYALLDFFGDTDKLGDWRDRITGEVKTYVDDINTAVGLAATGNNFRDGWTGSAANAFHDYIPKLTGAMDALSANMDDIGEGIGIHIEALTAVRTKFIGVLGDLAEAVIGIDVGGDEDDVKGSKIKSLFTGFLSSVGDILQAVVGGGFEVWAAVEEADSTIGTGYGALNDAKSPKGLVNIPDRSGPYQGSEMAHGYQLPMPTESTINEDWDGGDIKNKWERETSISLDPFMGFVSELRDQAGEWTKAADKIQDIYSEIVADPGAFSSGLGQGTWEACRDCVGARHTTLEWSDTRFNELADALALIAQEFGEVDDSASGDIEVSWHQLRND